VSFAGIAQAIAYDPEILTGKPKRLATLNAGMMRYYLYTDRQDYEWGEANDLIAIPAGQFTPHGLQEHRWVCLDDPD